MKNLQYQTAVADLNEGEIHGVTATTEWEFSTEVVMGSGRRIVAVTCNECGVFFRLANRKHF
jgi:hypothetical protein